ncbi:MAG: hypothetical protein H6R14_2178 [Proteobacteria bacterium]|nr:hypothetical protein [Pseudomonadota bacterium]
MNLRQANDVASRLFAFGGGAFVTLPSNTEIRELVEFIRAVLPGDRFDNALLAAVDAQPFRIDATFADLLHAQFAIANEVIDGDPILRHKVSREPEIPVQRETRAPSTFEVLAGIGYGLISILSLWRMWQNEPYGPWAVMSLAILMMVAIAFARRIKARRDRSRLDSLDAADDAVGDANFSGDCAGGGGD